MPTSRMLDYDPSMAPEIRHFASLAELSSAAATAVAEVAKDAVHQRGRCAIVLSGGSTPKTLYRLLATTHRGDVNWARVIPDTAISSTPPGSRIRFTVRSAAAES